MCDGASNSRSVVTGFVPVAPLGMTLPTPMVCTHKSRALGRFAERSLHTHKRHESEHRLINAMGHFRTNYWLLYF